MRQNTKIMQNNAKNNATIMQNNAGVVSRELKLAAFNALYLWDLRLDIGSGAGFFGKQHLC
jgi:hypothetical protein